MTDLFLIVQMVIRLLIYTIVGKGVLALLAGPGYRSNVVWRFFDVITRPIWRLTRAIAPHFIGDAAIGFLAVLLLIAINIGLYMVFHSQGWLTPPPASLPG
jgi:uncharacterized protein YggT (Ycf19 family)